MLEGLRLGHASTCRKLGNLQNCVTTNGAAQLQLEDASPPHNQVRTFNPNFNLLVTKERLETLETRGFVRKDMIGSRQEKLARPGMMSNEERLDKGPGQVTGQAAQAAEGLAIDLKQPYE